MADITNSEPPENWRELPKVTVVDIKHGSVGTAVLEKVGRKYKYVRYCNDRDNSGTFQPNHWTVPIPINSSDYAIIGGWNGPEASEAKSYRTAKSQWDNQYRDAEREAAWTAEQAKRDMRSGLLQKWLAGHPEPNVPECLQYK